MAATLTPQINTADEVLVTELILEGVFNALEPDELVALLSAFVFEERTENDPALTDRLKQVRPPPPPPSAYPWAQSRACHGGLTDPSRTASPPLPGDFGRASRPFCRSPSGSPRCKLLAACRFLRTSTSAAFILAWSRSCTSGPEAWYGHKLARRSAPTAQSHRSIVERRRRRYGAWVRQAFKQITDLTDVLEGPWAMMTGRRRLVWRHRSTAELPPPVGTRLICGGGWGGVGRGARFHCPLHRPLG